MYSANINLSGEITETKESFMFKLTCFSCWIPVMKSVHFFVNDVLVDNVRHTEDGCYHKRKMCSLTECSCSSKGNNYTWSYISNKTYLKFSCEMRFKDLKTSLLSFQRANLIFNNTGNLLSMTWYSVVCLFQHPAWTDTFVWSHSMPILADKKPEYSDTLLSPCVTDYTGYSVYKSLFYFVNVIVKTNVIE